MLIHKNNFLTKNKLYDIIYQNGGKIYMYDKILGLLILIELFTIGLGFYLGTDPIRKELKGIKEELEKLRKEQNKNHDKPE